MQRLTTALVISLAAFFVQPNWISTHTRVLVSWDLGTLIYLGLAWALIARSDAEMTRDHALSQDQSGYVIFLFVVSAACAGIVAIGFMVSTLKGLAFWPRAWHLALSIVALISAWLLIQTVFAFHYARHYYAVRRDRHSESAELRFPDNRERLPGFRLLLVRDRYDFTGIRRRRDLAQHAASHPDSWGAGIHLQYRGSRAQHQHHRQRDLGHAGGAAPMLPVQCFVLLGT